MSQEYIWRPRAFTPQGAPPPILPAKVHNLLGSLILTRTQGGGITKVVVITPDPFQSPSVLKTSRADPFQDISAIKTGRADPFGATSKLKGS